MNPNIIECYFDGCCAPVNPRGYMGMGAVVIKDNVGIFWHSSFELPNSKNSNNVAEYKALIAALKYLLDSGYQNEKIIVYGDSNLVVSQMKGKWRIKNGLYALTAFEAKRLVSKFTDITFEWIPREKNEEADYLSNLEMQKQIERDKKKGKYNLV